MNLPQLINRIRNGVYELINTPSKQTVVPQAKAKINQNVRFDDHTLRELTSNGKQVYIVQAAQINLQQSLTNEGTKVLTYIDQLQTALEDQARDQSLFEILLRKYNEGCTLKTIRDIVERLYIEIALANTPTQSDAARRLGIARSGIYERLKRLTYAEEAEPTMTKEITKCETQNSTD